MPLSEQDLLLLDCFMYSDLAPKSEIGSSLADIVNFFVDSKTGKISKELFNKRNIQFSGDMDASSFQDVLEDMRKSDALMNLRLMKTSPEYEGSIRAACFIDKDTKKATVAFRGTGGSYQQWYNNFEGYGDVSQGSQDDAKRFINSLPYSDIDVTGHSNGGDQAMYVSIVCADKISRCVSYEGQGVSKEFFKNYAKEIAQNKDTIKNICGEKDFVSPLLFNVAGETVYVPSDSDMLGGLLDHGAYGIYTANRKVLEENDGNFPESVYVDQAWYCQDIHRVTVILSLHSDVPYVGPVLELFSDVAGIAVGLIINQNWKDPKNIFKACEDLIIARNDLIIAIKDIAISEIQKCITAINVVCNCVINWINNITNRGGTYANANTHIIVDTYRLSNYSQRLSKINTRISNLDRRLDSLYFQVGLLDLWNLMQADVLTGHSWRLDRCVSYLNETATDFENAESALLNSL